MTKEEFSTSSARGTCTNTRLLSLEIQSWSRSSCQKGNSLLFFFTGGSTYNHTLSLELESSLSLCSVCPAQVAGPWWVLSINRVKKVVGMPVVIPGGLGLRAYIFNYLLFGGYILCFGGHPSGIYLWGGHSWGSRNSQFFKVHSDEYVW